MKTQNRRTFLTAALAGSGLAASGFVVPEKPFLIHQVLIWLKNPGDLEKLVSGTRALKKIETVRKIHIGVPAKTEPRPAIDSSYDMSVIVFFDDLAGEKAYQVHPIHKKFLETHASLWKKIQVYDVAEI